MPSTRCVHGNSFAVEETGTFSAKGYDLHTTILGLAAYSGKRSSGVIPEHHGNLQGVGGDADQGELLQLKMRRLERQRLTAPGATERLSVGYVWGGGPRARLATGLRLTAACMNCLCCG